MNDGIDDIEVVWCGQLPITKTTPVEGEKWPPGSWTGYEQFHTSNLAKLNVLISYIAPENERRATFLISQDRANLAIGLLPSQQQALPMEPATVVVARFEGPVSIPVDPGMHQADGNPASSDSAKAIQVAEGLLKAHDCGEHVSAEKLVHAMAVSPNPTVTSAALQNAGTGMAVHGAGTSFNPRQFGRFPEIIESEHLYRLTVKDFGALEETKVMVAFQRGHQEVADIEDAMGRLLERRKRIPIHFGNSTDEVVFRMGVAAKIDMDVMVSVSLSTFTREITAFTLQRLTDRSATADQMVEIVEQYRLPIA